MKANLGSELEYDVWIDTQVELLKTGRLRELDVANLIEELEDLGRSEKAACRSFVYQIILHKLLCNHWTEEQKRNLGHWTAEIIAFQFQLNDRLTTNIRNHLEDELENIYQKAAKAVEAKINNNSKTRSRYTSNIIEGFNNPIPYLCPYDLNEIIGE